MSDLGIAPEVTSIAAPAAPDEHFSLTVRLFAGYAQVADFRLPGVALLGMDEGPPRGHGWGPSPLHLLGSAIGACLGASLIQYLHDARVEVGDLRTDVTGTMRRNEKGQQRIESIHVRLSPVLTAAERDTIPLHPERLAEYGTVTESVREGIDVRVSITPELAGSAGARAASTGAV
jgi:uncharacterized OsmC-like protein